MDKIGKRVWEFTPIGSGIFYRPNKETDYTLVAIKKAIEVGDHCDHYIIKSDDGEEKEVREYNVLFQPMADARNEDERIYNYLKDNGIYAESYINSEGEVCVDISWGDWKHEHGWCRDLMGYIDYNEDDEIVTEENGSDCYSSIHYFSKAQ